MKKLLLNFLLLVCGVLVGCGNLKICSSMVTSVNSTKQVLLTEEQALEIAKKVINKSNKETKIDIDGTLTKEGEQYFIIHEYYLSPLDQNHEQTFTMGWYRLNRKTKMLYKQDMTSKEEKWDLVN